MFVGELLVTVYFFYCTALLREKFEFRCVNLCLFFVVLNVVCWSVHVVKFLLLEVCAISLVCVLNIYSRQFSTVISMFLQEFSLFSSFLFALLVFQVVQLCLLFVVGDVVVY